MNFAAAARKLLDDLGSGPIFVHSDAFRASRLVRGSRDRLALLDSHIAVLRDISADRSMWMPAFNYDFPQTGVFDVRLDPVQVGPIPERFRSTTAQWRTAVPMFTVAGTGPPPPVRWGDDTDPFGEESIFARLAEMNGVILYYGNTFATNTIVHYAERRYGGPAYRYDKRFRGRVIMPDGQSLSGSLSSHVRPLSHHVDYDWPRLLRLATAAGVCRPVENFPEVMAASARFIVEFWIRAMLDDPLSLLDAESRIWIEPALDRLGRRFTIADFEENG